MAHNLWEETLLPSLYYIMWLSTRATFKWHFIPGFPSGNPKIGTLVVLKFWTLISSSNQTFLDHARAISYSFQKNLSNSVLYTPIEDHLTVALRGFVVKSQVPNLIPNPSFDHNSCISGLNKQCKGTLSIYTWDISKDILGVQFGVFLPF
jgi:hypothetical protein